MDAQVALSMRGITKEFSGVCALRDVTFSVNAGELHALVGENGAGKSTLMKVLSGVYPATAYTGEITVFGEACAFVRPKDAERKGIAIIQQELMVLDELSIAENILLGHLRQKSGFVDWKAVYAHAQEALRAVGLDTDVRTKVGRLGVGQKQLVEIAKALSQKSRILILDEPTAALTEKESGLLFQVLEELRRQGITIIYISHRMEEVFRLSDRVTVLRDGMIIGTKATAEISCNEVISLMVGREITELYPPTAYEGGDELLAVENYCVYAPEHPDEPVVKDASFTVRRGEIVGFSGLLGSGRTELLSAVFGAYRGKATGRVLLKGAPASMRTPRDAIRSGVGFITEDRKKTGLIVDSGVGVNITLPVFSRLARAGFLSRSREKTTAQAQMERLRIKAKGLQETVKNLSGGNQQKIVIAKWLTTKPDLLVMDEPTRGVDVGAKSEIYRIMHELAKAGVGIVMISSDLPEVIGMSDRVYVMHEGSISGQLERAELSEQRIMEYAVGMGPNNEKEVHCHE